MFAGAEFNRDADKSCSRGVEKSDIDAGTDSRLDESTGYRLSASIIHQNEDYYQVWEDSSI